MCALAESEATLVRTGRPRTTLERLFLDEVGRPDPPRPGTDADTDNDEDEENEEEAS